MKVGGGLIGLLVLAAAIFLPRLLGGGASRLSDAGRAGEADGGPASARRECETEIEQIALRRHRRRRDVLDRASIRRPSAAQYQETFTVFFSGATNTGCGQATVADRARSTARPTASCTSTSSSSQQLQEQFGATGDLAAQYIVAHEYGHHVQNLLGISDQVQPASAAGPEPGQPVLDRPRAAGRLLRRRVGPRRRASASQLEPGEIDEALNAAAAVGDDRIQQQTQGRVNPESWTHGSSEQRVSWFRRGFETGDPDQCDTFERALDDAQPLTG